MSHLMTEQPFFEHPCSRIIGIDNDKDMIRAALMDAAPKESFMNIDARETSLRMDEFDKALIKMVLHHNCNMDSILIVREAMDLLDNGGLMLICEGVPPSDSENVIDFYKKTMSMKELRYSRTAEDYEDIMTNEGLKNVRTEYVILHSMSTRHWCYTSYVGRDVTRAILQRRLNAPKEVKDAYNMKRVRGDVLVDVRFALVTGRRDD